MVEIPGLARSKGFTLIELLVVIAIIGVLASIVLASLSSARAKGRDAKRLADIKQIQLALELYYDSNNAFPPNNTPTTFDASALTGAGYISAIPTDPSTGTQYRYTAYGSTAAGQSTVCSSYHLGATLETVRHIDLTQDADISVDSDGGSGGYIPPQGYTMCNPVGSNPPAGDFDGLNVGVNCGGTRGTPATLGGSGTEMCYDVRP